MKLKLFFSTLLGLLFVGSYAQDRTTVSATSSEISDNLDLRAVASIFGDSKDLEDFENRLNDPKNQISNLDLNDDNQVDYLRVIETVEGRTHLIVVQSVLGRDVFQDVATLEVEKDSNNRVQVQVVGDVYMYGSNYIYEPVYVHTPVIYSYFWVPNYRPYCSTWYWGYYPSFYYAWNPFPVFRYRSHIGLYINFNHHYNYVNYRRCQVAYNNYYGRRGNGYERQHPNRSFATRNAGYTNRHELDKTRNTRTVGSPRNEVAANGTRTRDVRSNDASPRNNTPRDVKSNGTSPRNNPSKDIKSNDASPRNTTPRSVRSEESSPRNTTPRDVRASESPRNNNPRDVRTVESPRNSSPREIRTQSPSRGNSGNAQMESPRSQNTPRSNERAMSAPREQRASSAGQRSASPRQESRGNSGGNQSRGGGQSRGSGRG